jgi:hypothetical protein
MRETRKVAGMSIPTQLPALNAESKRVLGAAERPERLPTDGPQAVSDPPRGTLDQLLCGPR